MAPDPPDITPLLSRLRGGEQAALAELFDRFRPQLRRMVELRLDPRLGPRASPSDVLQEAYLAALARAEHFFEREGMSFYVWLRLVDQLEAVHDPAALPGWLATTTQRECLRVLRAARRYDLTSSPEDSPVSPDQAGAMIEEEILAAELNAALRGAFAGLPARCRQLLSMLLSDPPLSYTEISATLSVPIGSIGPQRGRCLERLRHSPYLATFSDHEIVGSEAHDTRTSDAGGGQRA